MSFFKFAYVRGAQNALVSAGAIQPYASEYKADLAVKLAAEVISDESADSVTDPELAQAMALLASNSEDELTPEEIAQLEAAAADGQAELQDVMSDMGAGEEAAEEMDEEAAKEVVAYLKSAAAQGQINSVANQLPKGVQDFQGEAGARANAAYAHLNGRQGLANPKKNANPFTGAQKAHSEGVSLDAKTAAAILRKLSADAIPADAAAIGGSNQDAQNDGRADAYANNSSQGNAKGDSNATPYTGKMTNHSDNVSASMLDLNSGDSSETKESAYNYLLFKTAEEVGPFLPAGLTDTDKLAALRTMLGMTQGERAQYIDRIKWAMSEEEEKEESRGDMPPALREALEKKENKKEDKEEDKEEDEEKEASYILRQLGLGR